MNSLKNNIDEDLYSRQLAVTGRDAMKKMSLANVLIIGLQDGVGTEIAKNLAFKGVNKLILYDSNNINHMDLETGCFYKKEDIGKNRAIILQEKIKELNSYVNVISCNACDINENYLKEINVLIVHPNNFKYAQTLNDLCRKTNTKFIMVRVCGFSGLIFNDFGDNHTVYDNDGEKTEPFQLENINETGLVKCDKCVHNLQSGHFVKFSNLEGNNIEQLQTKAIWEVKVKTATTFELIGWKSQKHVFYNGTCQRVKLSKEIKFKTLTNEINDPSLNVDFMNPSLPANNFSAWKFLDGLENYITPWSPFINKLANEDKFLMDFLNSYKFNHVGVNSIFGALVAEETYKAITGKTTPMQQWFSWCDFSMIPKTKPLDISDINSITRLYGNAFFKKISNLNLLVVGSGAIGCELLKNFALMNISTNSDGNVIVTDPDIIEKSNLNRQFLFRTKDVGKFKSVVAANAINNMRPNFNVTGQTHKVCEENEKIFNEDFYCKHIDLVANALDNMKARLYVDQQCVRWGVPLLESGTMGTKGNTQVIIPHLTQSYGSTTDTPVTNEVPVCTLKNFPNRIEHTIHWAMDEFSGLFTIMPSDINNYLDDNNYYKKLEPIERNRVLYNLRIYFENYYPLNWDKIINIAVNRFYYQYRNRIKQLLHSFPDTFINKDGSKFWSAGKRKPHALSFNKFDKDHINYIYAFTRLMGNIYNLNEPPSIEQVIKIIENIKIDDFYPDKYIHTASNDEEEKKNTNSFDSIKQQNDLEEQYICDKLNVQEFEKDCDSNWHVRFITACSNLRASNYNIPPIDNLETKLIAGRIIPAISTTTSIVAGFISMELYKLYMNDMTIEDFKSYFINIADNTCIPSEPLPPSKNKIGNIELTIWDKFQYTIDSTLEQFKQYWEDKFNVQLSMILYGSSIIWSSFFGNKMNDMRISDIIKKNYNKNIYKETIEIIIGTMDDNDLPPICLRIKSDYYAYKLCVNDKCYYLNKTELEESKLWKKLNINEMIPKIDIDSIETCKLEETIINYLKMLRFYLKENIDYENLSKPIKKEDFESMVDTNTYKYMINFSKNQFKNLLELTNYLDSVGLAEILSAFYSWKYIRNVHFKDIDETLF